MVSEATENKAKVIIKTFLLANKGKKYTSKEIAEFINNNNFGLGKYGVSNVTITKWITNAKPNTILHEVNSDRPTKKHLWRFWI